MKPKIEESIHRPKVLERTVDILGWPTDTISIDFPDAETIPVHTTLVFFPGNPGCCAWYQPILFDLVKALGPGFCARLVSYAGHNPYDPHHSNVEEQEDIKDASIVWTVDGQIRHKETFVDKYCTSWNGQQQQQLIFLSHSIGCHMVERLLMQRTDILGRTVSVIHIMPFVRMKAPGYFDQLQLDIGGANPNLLVGCSRTAMKLLLRLYSLESLNALLENQKVYQDPNGRDLASHLLRQPHYARNFFELGTEEIRDVPRVMDQTAMSQITRHCQVTLLYCANDKWAPFEHVPEILEVSKKLPSTHHPISIHYFPNHTHDFVSVDSMVPPVTECCLEAIEQSLGRRKSTDNRVISRL